MRRKPLHLRINPVACDGFGYCAELLPERIELDEWGFPVVERGVLPAALIDAARRCVTSCPRNAITLEVVAEATERVPSRAQ